MKTKQITKIRDAAAAEKSAGRGVRYSAGIKHSAVKLIRSGDVTAKELSKLTGIGDATLMSWVEGIAFKKIKLSTGDIGTTSADRTLSLVLPSGARIEGFSFYELRDLIEALAS